MKALNTRKRRIEREKVRNGREREREETRRANPTGSQNRTSSTMLPSNKFNIIIINFLDNAQFQWGPPAWGP